MKRLTLLACLLSTAIASAQVQEPPQWNSTSSFVGGGLVRASDGNFYRCLKTNTNHNPVLDAHSYWELYYVRAAITLTVATGGRFTSLKTAWAMASSATISSAASVTIRIDTSKQPYTEGFTNSFSLDATSGSQIFIRGDNSTRITLSFSNGAGMDMDDSHRLGSLTGVTLSSSDATGVALTANQHSDVADFSGNVIKGFLHGVHALEHSSVYMFGSNVSGAVVFGIWAEDGSNINAGNSSVTGTSAQSGIGIYATKGSTVNAPGATVSVTNNGFSADSNSIITADGGIASGCGNGFVAKAGSTIEATNSVATNNTSWGYYCNDGGRIVCRSATVSGNQSGDFHPAPNAIDALGNLIIN